MSEVNRDQEEETQHILQRLPQELLGEVGAQLGNKLDVLRFRSTCKLWRFLLPSTPMIFPLKIPTPPPLAAHHPFIITELTGYACKFPSSTQKNAVLLALESRQGRQQLLFTPYIIYGSDHYYTKGSPRFLEALNLQQYSISSVLFKTYCVRLRRTLTTYSVITKVAMILYYESKSRHKPVSIDKLAHYSTSVGDNNGDNLAVVALSSAGGLILWRSRFTEWETISTCKKDIDDIVNYLGKCWAIGRHGETFVVNTKSLNMTCVAPPPKEAHTVIDKGRKRLVEVSGDLYMLFPCRDRDPNNKLNTLNKIKVFRMQESGWIEVSSLGNYIFFVGLEFSFGILAGKELCFSKDEIRECNNGNCIFLDGLSFCRDIRSVKRSRDYPLFKEMYKAYPLGVYNKGCDMFKVISQQDLPEIFCSTIFNSPYGIE